MKNMNARIIAFSTVAVLVLFGAAGGLIGACAPSAASDNDAGPPPPVCNPDSGDTVGCQCDPGTFLPVDCYTGPAGTSGKGICQTGRRACNTDGTLSACVGEITPQVEICNLADDDCNGIVDDVQSIVEAGTLANCNSPACDPNYTDAAINCWGPDLGICGAGRRVCAPGPKGGNPNGCTEFIHAGVPEVCNGLDDDCNGLIDDGLTSDGQCTMDDGSLWSNFPEASLLDTTNQTIILGACQNGQLQCVDSNCTDRACADAGDQCFPTLPAAETCNGIDDDCNGIIDEHSCATSYYKFCCTYGTYHSCLPSYYTNYGYTCYDAGP